MTPVCPKCDVGLFIVHFRDIEVDYCHQCRGLWLDAGELEALMKRTGASANDPVLQFQHHHGKEPRGKKRLCPRCDRPLREITVDDRAGLALTLDKCPRGHGLWFDADELKQLLALFPPQSGTSKTVDLLHEIFGPALKP